MNGLHDFEGKDYSQDLEVYDLLFQTSGLPDYFTEKIGESRGLSEQAKHEDFYMTFDELIVRTKQLKPHFAPRTKGKAYYSDINFDILDIVFENVSGMPVAEAFRQMIFAPLGMDNTYLVTGLDDFVPPVYLNSKGIERPQVFRTFKSSGGAVSTARDMMTFLKAFVGGTLFKRETFRMLETYRSIPSMGPIEYGGGHMRISLRTINTLFMGKGALIGHSGSTGSFAFYYPEKDLFFVGDLNQIADPSLPIRLVMQLAMTIRV